MGILKNDAHGRVKPQLAGALAGLQERIFRFAVFSNFAVHIIFTDDLYESAMKIAIRDCHNAPSDELQSDASLHNIDACQINTPKSSYLYFKPGVSIGTIAHESWHMVYAMLKVMGCSLDDEVIAYHLGYVVNQVVDFRRELRIGCNSAL